MNKESLFESIGGIDEELLERSEKSPKNAVAFWKAVAILAACVCIVAAVWAMIPGFDVLYTPEETGEQTVLPPPDNGNWTVHYIQQNPGDVQTMVTGEGTCYQEYMTPEELESLLPDNRPVWMQGWGNAFFFEDRTPGRVVLHLETPVKNVSVQVAISQNALQDCVLYPGEVSVCNGVEYSVFQYTDKKERVTLKATGWVGAYWHHFTMTLWPEDVEAGKAAFKELLEAFTYYGETPYWSGLYYEYSKDILQKEVDWETAKQDAAFGAYIPRKEPEGAEFVFGSQYTDANTDRLSLTWKVDNRTVRWEVSRYDPKVHNRDLTNPADLWRIEYGGCIFPAEVLTKRFVTEGIIAWKLQGVWSLKYQDKLITVSHGQSSLWVWEQLVMLGIVEEGPDYTAREVYPALWAEESALAELFPEKLAEAMERCGGHPVFTFYEGEDRAYLEAQVINTEERHLLWLQIAPREDDEKPGVDAGELTVDAISSQVYRVSSDKEPRIEFGVGCGDKTVWVFASGYTPEVIYECLQVLK